MARMTKMTVAMRRPKGTRARSSRIARKVGFAVSVSGSTAFRQWGALSIGLAVGRPARTRRQICQIEHRRPRRTSPCQLPSRLVKRRLTPDMKICELTRGRCPAGGLLKAGLLRLLEGQLGQGL